jgi:hypothetical protein
MADQSENPNTQKGTSVMTTKVFCDGCDDHISEPHRVNRVVVSYPIRAGGVGREPEEFDLCSSCIDAFRFQHTPKKWARAAKPKAVAA